MKSCRNTPKSRQSSAPSRLPRKQLRVERMADLVEGRGSRGPKPKGFQIRFWENVPRGKPGECWEWKGERMNTGYGVLSVCNWRYLAHRLSYLIHNGRIDPDLMVMHSCDNPLCVNPAHLAQGTCKDNIRDAVAKGRLGLGELNGMHKLREQDVLWIRQQYSTGAWSMKQLAAVFGVHVPCIHRIINRVRWSHL